MKKLLLVALGMVAVGASLWCYINLAPQKSRVSQHTIALNEAKSILAELGRASASESGEVANLNRAFAARLEAKVPSHWTRSAPSASASTKYDFGLLLFVPNDFPSNSPVVVAVTTPLTNYAGYVSRLAFVYIDGQFSSLLLRDPNFYFAPEGERIRKYFSRNPDLYYRH
jgi:hypothetical protein